jgi:hypothetical protein
VGQKGATVKELKSRSDVDVLSIGNRDDVEKLNDVRAHTFAVRHLIVWAIREMEYKSYVHVA